MQPSHTQIIDRMKQGDFSEFDRIVAAHWDRLVRISNRKLGKHAGKMRDGEDVAQSVFRVLAEGLQGEQHTWVRRKVNDTASLADVVVMMAIQRSINAINYENAQRRRGTVREADVGEEASRQLLAAEDERMGDAMELTVRETVEKLREQLGDDYAAVLRGTLEGESLGEIAGRLRKSERTIQRYQIAIRTAVGEWADFTHHPAT